MRKIIPLLLLLCSTATFSQVITKEDSLSVGLVPANSNTVLSGYGEVVVNYNLKTRTAIADLRRNVMFFGHKFSDKISFFSELEIEHALVEMPEEEGGSSGEVAMEQLFIKFNLNKNNYITAGLIIPRIGVINENHLPTTYNGNDRPFVERLVIPSTWRELGISWYGNFRRIGGLNYSVAIMNGLSSASFESENGIRGGRGEGSRASASNMAVTGALLYYTGNWRFQLSGYTCGTAGITKTEADTLKLSNGAFGTPVHLGEISIQRKAKVLSVKALATFINIPDAYAINRAYKNNTANNIAGGYLEAGINIFHFFNATSQKNLTIFSRIEWMDLQLKRPDNAIADNTLIKKYLVAGVSWLPIRGIVIKADYVMSSIGDPNKTFGSDIISPTASTNSPLTFSRNGYCNLGIGYSF